MAAVLACGGGAVLSHRSAASLWNLLPATDGPIDVTVRSSGGRKKRQGLRIHRCSSLPGSATTIRKRIAVTTPARTLTDLRRVVPPGQHRKAVRQAEFLGLPLGESECHRTRSELERLFLRLCRRHRLPPPEVNVRIGYYVVDFLWCHHRLIVEADGWGAHRGRAAFEDDHARDIELKLRGYEVLRFTYAQITSEPARVAAAIRAVMARSSPHARLKRQPAP